MKKRVNRDNNHFSSHNKIPLNTHQNFFSNQGRRALLSNKLTKDKHSPSKLFQIYNELDQILPKVIDEPLYKNKYTHNKNQGRKDPSIKHSKSVKTAYKPRMARSQRDDNKKTIYKLSTHIMEDEFK